MSDPYLSKMLGDNETVLVTTRRHWFVFVQSIITESLLFLAIIIMVFLANSNFGKQLPWLNYLYFLLFVPVFSFIWDFFQWWNRQYVITSLRVIQISGIINKDVIDSSLEKVNDVKLTQSFFGRIFNFGTVEILTASELGVNKIQTLGDPIKFKTVMINAKQNLESGGYANMQSKGIPSPAEIPAMIAQLDSLRQQGLLTPEEFQAKKAELLKRM